MALHDCFYFRCKKDNSTKKKNEHGDIELIIRFYGNSLKSNKFFVSVVTLSDIFYSRFNDVLTLMFYKK